MAVIHYDIDDQFNPGNIAAAEKAREEDIQWRKTYGKQMKGYKYICELPELDEEPIEV